MVQISPLEGRGFLQLKYDHQLGCSRFSPIIKWCIGFRLKS